MNTETKDPNFSKWWNRFKMEVLTGKESAMPMMEMVAWEHYRNWYKRISYSRIMTDRDGDIAAAGWAACLQWQKDEKAKEINK